MSDHLLQYDTSKNYIPEWQCKIWFQAPQKCTSTTKGLLHFDLFSQQMYFCDGGQWKKWSSDGKDEQSDSRSNDKQCTSGKSLFVMSDYYDKKFNGDVI